MKLEKDLYAYLWQDPYENNCNTYVIDGEMTILIDPGHTSHLNGEKMMKIDLTDKIAIITGAAGGIGRGMARMFSENGASIVVNDLNEDKGNQVVEEIKASGGRAIFVKANVGERKEAQEMVEKTLAAFGNIDILINNAGINIPMDARGPIHEFPDEMWEKIINVDLDGVYHCSKAALQSMTQNGYGKIINIGSIVGAVPLRNQCAFAAAITHIDRLACVC